MNVSLRLKQIILCAAAGAAFAVAGRAGTLPDPAISGGVFNNSSGDFTLCSTLGHCAFEGSSLDISANLGANPLHTGAVIIAGQAGADHSFSAFYTYAFHITGGLDGDVVPYDVDYILKADGVGDGLHGFVDTGGANIEVGGTRASLSYDDINGGAIRICGATCFDSSSGHTWAGTLHLSGVSGDLGFISLSISGSAQDGFGSASADPHVYIDPAFLATHPGYDVILPDGVGNELASAADTATPEPSSLLLAWLGLAGCLMAHRRRDNRFVHRAGTLK